MGKHCNEDNAGSAPQLAGARHFQLERLLAAQRCVNVSEDTGKRAAERIDGQDDCDRDAGSNQAILDGRGARLRAIEVLIFDTPFDWVIPWPPAAFCRSMEPDAENSSAGLDTR
jgi:hypothetical protein